MAAVLRVSFSVEEPPTFPGGGGLARALYNISRSAYESRSNACGGGYIREADIQVMYLSKAAYEQMKSTLEQNEKAASTEASGNL